ncbi:unnamed protein product [Linum tenue]|uniref:Cytochrome P450 n=1 Tax=Linum tenue TaxID=586396 RepID=A0AAV0L4A6_9ROSI|nr:unnamed protein product [Linum tenue]
MEELNQEVGRERWVREGDIPNLVYLQAVVKETLRMYPPGHLGVPREANEDCCIAGYHVPKGTWVFLNVLRLHRDLGTWNSPLEFMPKRLLLKPEYLIGNKKFEYAPFGKGRRDCPGVLMANQVMHLTLSTLLQGSHLTVSGDSLVDMTKHYTVTTRVLA